MPDIILFQKSRTAFMVQVFKKRIKEYTWWILQHVFLGWWTIIAVFSNWYRNFQPSRSLVSYNVIFALAQVAAQLGWHCSPCRYWGGIPTSILGCLRRFYLCRDSFSPFFCYVPPNQRMIRITAELMPFGMGSFVEIMQRLSHDGLGPLRQLSSQSMTLFVLLSKVLRFKRCPETDIIVCAFSVQVFTHGEAKLQRSLAASAQNNVSWGGRALSRYHSWQRVFFPCMLWWLQLRHMTTLSPSPPLLALSPLHGKEADGAVLGATNTT